MTLVMFAVIAAPIVIALAVFTLSLCRASHNGDVLHEDALNDGSVFERKPDGKLAAALRDSNQLN